jgi:leucyl aminopeptidase (aminopeptidase T)
VRKFLIRLICQEGTNSLVQRFRDYAPLVKEVFDTSLGVESSDRVWIQSWDHTVDLAVAITSECSSRACPYLLSVRHQDVWLQSIRRSPIERLASITPQEKTMLQETDFYIFTMGPRSPIPWNSIPEVKREQVSVWLDTRYDRSLYARRWSRLAKANRVKMLAIEATLATRERARAQGLDYEEWRDVMFQGCMADHGAIAKRAKKLSRLLSGKGQLSITSPTGTSLVFDLDRRPVGVSDGIATKEMAELGRIVFLPAGAIEVSVDEESANGRIAYGAPVRLGNNVIKNLVLVLKDGLIVRYSATQGKEAFEHYLKEGGQDAARFSYFGFGLNPNLRHGFTQDDKVLGGLTLGFGENRSMGGKNPAKDQWWASVPETTVKLNSQTLIARGKLII